MTFQIFSQARSATGSRPSSNSMWSMKVSIGLPVRPLSCDALREEVAAFVAPAELGDETVPDVTLLVGARDAVGVRPAQDSFVGHAGQCSTLDL